MTVAIVVGDDAVRNSFASAVEQRLPSGEDLARSGDARTVQETAIELKDEEVVKIVIRYSAVDQDMNEVAAVTGVVVSDSTGNDIKIVP